MGLINLKTNLKSLRYGNDQLGGGSSNQPYIKADIPAGFNGLQSSSNDFILRGGALTVRNSALDVSRLTKMFTDTKSPNGLLFIAKQNLLSRTAVRTQTSGILNEGIYTPLSTLTEAGLVGFGGHVLKQGLNPFDGTGAYSNNPNLYDVRIKYTQPVEENRLTELNRLIYINNSSISNFGFIKGFSLNDGINILSYDGGPGSTLGVGKTNIRFASNLTVGNPNSSEYNKTINFPNDSLLYTQPDLSGPDGANINKDTRLSPSIRDFRKLLRKGLSQSTILSESPNYEDKNIENRVNIGGKNKLGPGNRTGKNLISYTNGSGIGPVDLINASLLYHTNSNPSVGELNDLVKFRIAIIDNQNPTFKTFMHFRAFIDSFSDSYNTSWNPITYLGRGENFYTYSNFTRAINLSWTIAAQSKEELIPMYKKLNYLASSLTPYYTPKGYMAGNLIQLTVGGYLYEQVGFFTSLTYDMSDSTWEIGLNDNGGNDSSVKELPKVIKVTTNFIPIHDFIPSLQYNDYDGLNEVGVAKYGPQRYIALNDGSNNNYTSDAVINKLQPKQPNPLPASQPNITLPQQRAIP